MMKEKTAIFILVVIYLVGIVGILLPFHADFILLTPFNLIISLLLVLYFHGKWTKEMTAYMLIAFWLGFGIEIVGVNTGLVFGEYKYGQVLGWKLWGTPLMIGVNWVLLTYCSATVMNRLFKRAGLWYKALIGAGIMTYLDYWIEPVAMHYGFWSWTNNDVPMQNYFAWFVIAYVILVIFYKLVGKTKNKVAEALLILQFVFFFILHISL